MAKGITMATSAEAQQAIIDQIAKSAPGASVPNLLRLAEAYAWVVAPNNTHGGTSS
jgi:hypothetical protein